MNTVTRSLGSNDQNLHPMGGRLLPGLPTTVATTYKGKGEPGLIEEKMEGGLENIDKCLIRDERKVRIYKEYFLPANRSILSIHDLTKTDHGKLDALTNRYLKSWLGMPQGGSFLPVHSGLGMDVIQGEPIPGHC
jgi:hypothetical protein